MEVLMFNFSNNSYGNKTINNLSQITALDNFETLQKARQDLIGEIQAVIEYDTHLHSTTDRLAMETWLSIKNEELVHIGELLALLNHLDSSQQKYVQTGINEFIERLNKK